MRLTVFVAFIVCCSNVFAQDTFISISGRVIDRETKEPLPFASVYLKGKTIGTTTNLEGRFLFHVPSTSAGDSVVVSMIGYDNVVSIVETMAGAERVVALKPSTTMLNEVVVKAPKKEQTAKAIVKAAVAKIPDNYAMTPFMIEGFFRDLQRENGKPVELLEAALRFRYKDYNPGLEEVEIVEVRRSFNKRHPVNGTYDRQNSIFDLMEDNYVKQRFGPLDTKGWKYAIDSTFSYNRRTVYKISGTNGASAQTQMIVDADTYAILKLEMKNTMVNGEYYRRYINLPDPHGLQETSFRMAFEFQEIEGKWYLKYQCEEDSYDLFNKTTREVIVKQSFVKELFVNNVVTRNVPPATQQMTINKSVEGQAAAYNAGFWKFYNTPVETSADSQIVEELQQLQFNKGNQN